MTLLLVLVFIATLFFCGLGPALLLFPRDSSGHRLLLAPTLGLCSHVLFSIFAAQFGLTGRDISALALAAFLVLGAAGLRRSAPSLAELRRALLPLSLGFAAVGLVGWPLLWAGYQDYWGLANPDQAFLTPVLEWLHTHRLGVPPRYEELFRGIGFRNIPPNTLLGVFYPISTVALVSGVAPGLLFNVAALCMVFLTPTNVYTFAESLGLPRKTSLLAAFVMLCSSLLAYTFYAGSLAALSVVAVVPAGLVLALRFVERPTIGRALPVAVLCASMYYNYLGMIGVLGVLVAVVLADAALSRRIPLRAAVLLAGLTLGLVVVAFAPYAHLIFRFFFEEVLSSRFAVRSETQEILAYYALILTEEGLPYFWGIHSLGRPSQWLGPSILPVFVAACCFFAVFLFAFVRRISRLPRVYSWLAGIAILMILFYSYRRVAYGVFKLVAWVHPIIVVGLVAAGAGSWQCLRARGFRRLAYVPVLLLVLFVALNLQVVIRAGSYSLSGESVHNAPRLSFREVRQLSEASGPWRRDGIAIMLPDPVTAAWAESQLVSVKHLLLPYVTLSVYDSKPQTSRSPLGVPYLLHSNDAGADIYPIPGGPLLWSNKKFVIRTVKDCRNCMVLGEGWYRAEYRPASPFPWMKRFRWLRKRAELLVLNPLESPQRLVAGTVSGFGNPAPDRHVTVFLNGQKIDEWKISGAARLISRPFVARGPWSQIELEVRENAATLRRDRPLWNSWVPKEPRRLNLAVYDVELVPDGAEKAMVGSTLDLLSAEQSRQALMNGIYPDRWVGADAEVTLRLQPNADAVRIRGDVPAVSALRFPYSIGIAVNGLALPAVTVSGPGAFEADCTIPQQVRRSLKAGHLITLRLAPQATFAPLATGERADPRELSIRLERIALIARPAGPEREGDGSAARRPGRGTPQAPD